MLPQPQQQAPPISTTDQHGNHIALSDFLGKKVVLYFYPKDDTLTCTAQACNLRDNFEALTQKGIVVLGVSIDNEKSHTKFINKYQLPFTLLTDTDKKIVNDYGLWGEKKFMGKTYMGTKRTTYLINEAGIIDHIIEKVESKKHTAQIQQFRIKIF